MIERCIFLKSLPLSLVANTKMRSSRLRRAGGSSEDNEEYGIGSTCPVKQENFGNRADDVFAVRLVRKRHSINPINSASNPLIC
jgi:hypothetical protein